MTRIVTLFFSLVFLFVWPALAGSLEIGTPQIRATVPGMQATGGYLTITNHGDTNDRLVSATAGFAARVELHEMILDREVMRMRAREGGIEVPAGTTVELKPGGLHLMLMGLKETMMPGETREVTLTFQSGYSITLPAMVMKPGEIGGHGHNRGHNKSHNQDHN